MQHVLRWDAINCFLAWRYNVAELIADGHLPLWSTWQHLGFPLHADPETGAWYPIVWIISIVYGYDFYAISFEWCLHIFIAGFGMYRLMRSMEAGEIAAWVAGISFMACGVFVSNAQNFIYLIGLAWMPWVVMYIRLSYQSSQLKYAVWAALALWMMLTGSYPGISIMAFYCLLVYAVYFFIVGRLLKNKVQLIKWVKVNVVLGLLTLMLTAPHLLSVYEYLPEVTRTEGLSKERLLENPFPPKAWVSILVPYSVGADTYLAEHSNSVAKFAWGSDFSMLNGYMGLLTLMSILVWLITQGKTKREYFLFGGFVVLMILASGDIFPLRWWSRLLPGLDLFRHPSIFRFMGIFAAVVLGALCLNRLIKTSEEFTKKRILIVYTILLFSLIILISFNLPPSLSETFHQFYTELFSFPEPSHFGISQRIFVHAIIQIILLFSIAYLWRKKKWNYLPLVVFLDLFIAVQLNIHGTVVYPIHISQAQKELRKTEANRMTYSGDNIIHHDSPSCGLKIPGLVCNHNIFLHQPAWDGYNSYILDGYRDLEHSGTYPECFHYPLIYSTDSSFVDNIKISSNRIDANTAGGTLILQQNYHPNWHCKQNGKNLPIEKVNYTMMKVNAEKGNVSFVYESGMAIVGIALMVLGLVVTFVILIGGGLLRNRKKRSFAGVRQGDSM
ncbi:MAG: hypothetical protein SGI87_03620 [Flavobacteriales bacterium]|nr:hypothetical protein [Flavobacteriales bacterium]